MDTTLNTRFHRLSLLAAAAALTLGLAACDRSDDRTAGQQLDSAVAKTESAAQEAKENTAEAMRDAKQATEQAAADAKDATQEAGAEIRQQASEVKAEVSAAADQAGAAVSEAAEKAGAAVSDAATTAAVNAKLVADSELSAIRIDVDTKDGVVTLNGPAPNAAAKERATTIAQAVDGVKSVNNHLTVN